jgi:hypothetical protein
VRRSPIGTPTTSGSADDGWVWSIRWDENWQGKPTYSKNAYKSKALVQ